MTSIGRLEDVPSVIPDIQQGISAMMRHLIRTHGYRRLVFLRGPAGEETAEAGYRGYQQTLAAYGIDFNPSLVSPTPQQWGKSGGTASILALLDERHLQPGRDFDAIVGLGDNETLGAMELLQARGYNLPFDVAVSGLNNIEIARFITPSLTTVDRQIAEVARQATSRLFDLLQGHDVPLRTVVQPTVIVRRSCGCMPTTVLQAASNPPPPGIVNRSGCRGRRPHDHPGSAQGCRPAQHDRFDPRPAPRLERATRRRLFRGP
jgi:sigma-B regulation protein RsbU (phosphoserine phosphatase)